MKIVFFGTPDYSVKILESVHRKFKTKNGSPIVAVVTQNPKRVGRKKELIYSPVDKWAFQKKIPVYFESKKIIELSPEADVGVLAAYGEILPKSVLNYFPHGIINIHPSLLPKYRGASPIKGAIAAGEVETGVSIIKLDEKMDHGPIVAQSKEDIKKDDTADSLRERLFEKSTELLNESLLPYLTGKIKPKNQEHGLASYTTLLKKDHGYIHPGFIKHAMDGKALTNEWNIEFIKRISADKNSKEDFLILPSPESVERYIRAVSSWPGAWTEIKITKNKQSSIQRLKIIKAHLEILPTNNNVILALDTVQLEGKSSVSWKQFKEGRQDAGF